MAIFAHPTIAQPAAGAPTQVAAADATTSGGGSAPAPEPRFLAWATVAIVVGVIVGTLIYDHWSKAIAFTPPTGVGIFALFYIMAQVIERVQEPVAPYLGTAPSDVPGARTNKPQAKAALEKAVATALANPSDANARAAADKKRTTDQIRANLTVLMFGTSAFLSMIMSGYLKARLLQTVGVQGIVSWVDILVTGLAVGAGTKPLHDLISNISSSSEEKQSPSATS